MGKFIEEHWALISAHPTTFIIFGILVFLAGFGSARILLGGALSTCRERLEAAKDDIARLKGEKDSLVQQLTDHGDSIEEIKAKLEAQPKIHISSEPPPPNSSPKDGEIWIQHEK